MSILFLTPSPPHVCAFAINTRVFTDVLGPLGQANLLIFRGIHKLHRHTVHAVYEFPQSTRFDRYQGIFRNLGPSWPGQPADIEGYS